MNSSPGATSALLPQLERLLELVSPRVGLIRALARRVRSDDEPSLPLIYDALLANFDFRKGEAAERGSCGKGFSEEEAMLGAIGEAVEHYCASHPAMRRMRRSTRAALDGALIEPGEFVLFSAQQYATKGFAFRPYLEKHEIPWTSAIDLETRKQCWVPSTLVYLNYSGEQPHEYLCPPTSSGMAAGSTRAHALNRALLELIEREAFLVTWMNRLSVPELAMRELAGPVAQIARDYAEEGVRFRLFVLPTDLPAWAVMAVAFSDDDTKPAAVVGLGCDPRLENAARRAVFEVCQIYEPLRRKHEKGLAAALNAYSDVHTLEQHAAYFFRKDHVHELDFLGGTGRTFRLEDAVDHTGSSPEDECDALASAVRSRGSRALCVELTTPDLDGYPIHVMRALITQMQPIHFGHGQERLGGQRLYELPRVLGYTNVATTEASLNPCPHPLA